MMLSVITIIGLLCNFECVSGQVKFESFLSPAGYKPHFFVLIPLGLGLPLGPHGLWTCLS